MALLSDLRKASATKAGLITNVTQNIAGIKTFDSGISSQIIYGLTGSLALPVQSTWYSTGIAITNMSYGFWLISNRHNGQVNTSRALHALWVGSSGTVSIDAIISGLNGIELQNNAGVLEIRRTGTFSGSTFYSIFKIA